MLKVHEVAERLGCKSQTVYRLIAQGRLHAIDIGTQSQHNYRISEEALLQFLANSQAKTAPQSEPPKQISIRATEFLKKVMNK